MARIPRLTVDDEPAVYHVISRTALDGFVLGDNVTEAIQLWIDTAHEFGDLVPEPKGERLLLA